MKQNVKNHLKHSNLIHRQTSSKFTVLSGEDDLKKVTVKLLEQPKIMN